MFLAPALRSQISAEARAAFPRECCGLLEGSAKRITALHPTRNLAIEPDCFEIDSAEQFRLMREGCRIVGCYHSHPNGAPAPSPRDIEGAGEIGFVWIIAADDALGAYVWDGARFRPLVLLDSPDA